MLLQHRIGITIKTISNDLGEESSNESEVFARVDGVGDEVARVALSARDVPVGARCRGLILRPTSFGPGEDLGAFVELSSQVDRE